VVIAVFFYLYQVTNKASELPRSLDFGASHFIESTLCIEFSMGLKSGCPSPNSFKP
jgi:hypothetical protein